MSSQLTPMMQQFMSFKNRYPDKVVLFRMGDFYETFGDDAEKASKLLNITLTSRDKKKDAMPMAGFPHHALDQYLKKFIDAEESVVIVDQLEDPKLAKGIVKRGVTRIVTPGTADGDLLDDSSSAYILALYSEKGKRKSDDSYIIAFADLSSGEFNITERLTVSETRNLIDRLTPREILVDDPDFTNIPLGKYKTQDLKTYGYDKKDASKTIREFFNVNSAHSLGYQDDSPQLYPISMILYYIRETQRARPEHMALPKLYNLRDTMVLDAGTVRNLELLESLTPQGKGNKTLYGVLNDCETSMGARTLRKWILSPLINAEKIEVRQEIVQRFYSQSSACDNVKTNLSRIYDIERLAGKIGLGRANPRDLLSLAVSIENATVLIENLRELSITDTWQDTFAQKLQPLADEINRTIHPEAPVTTTEGAIIAEGYDEEIDELRKMTVRTDEWFREFLENERKKTGITSMKLGFNKVFGYYLDVTKVHQDKVPEHYIRKQTLVNSERYITEELKEREESILTAKQKLAEKEYEIFVRLRSSLVPYLQDMLEVAGAIAEIDVLAGFAHIANKYSYVRPNLRPRGGVKSYLVIKAGRHPVVENMLDEPFISNDVDLGLAKPKFAILTGPNMSGKSTYIREVALLALMAHIGSFVPADSMELTVVDRIFARVGASDDLAGGRSTFMVEMDETAVILNNATPDSLIILDEVGRGTSTYDGVSIAWAISEYLLEQIQARVLFATHYHELNDLEDAYPGGIQNLRIAVRDDGKKVVFLRKVEDGRSNKSYGIHVASLAGIPASVIKRAKSLLANLERSRKKIDASQYSLGLPDRDD